MRLKLGPEMDFITSMILSVLKCLEHFYFWNMDKFGMLSQKTVDSLKQRWELRKNWSEKKMCVVGTLSMSLLRGTITFLGAE